METERSENDRRSVEAGDLLVAASLLTRLPVPIDHARAGRRAAAAGWAFPLVGAVLGAGGGGVYWGCLAVGVAPLASAALALGLVALATGALHEDGLADTADGLGAVGRSAEERRVIMRDSRLGAFGVLAMVIGLVARLGALAAMPGGIGFAALIAASSMSRAAAPLTMAVVRPAQGDGLSARAGRAPLGSAALAVLLGILCAAIAVTPIAQPGRAVLALGVAIAASAVIAGLLLHGACRRIGGQTGDVLGATVIVVEAVTLIVLGALLSA